MTNLEKSTKRNTSKGRLAKAILATATDQELETAETVFQRPAPSFADVELTILPILKRANEQ